ncbi:TetR/AcrR family transcriptional regulator [Nocardia paucivorans]|uniref:TetR/AcrR family transcriptional regulator n=1 Tax=Nocardia paucivorans TaxID=114259 RepID=UPI0006851972|nr:TetR/AcrR family transcriptional regulator [Nocardia paucivorans]
MKIPDRPAGARPRRAEAIFTAAIDLLTTHGYDGMTIEAVAHRAGVNKTTIYRWWPSKDALLADALAESRVLSFAVPDTGSLRGDLLALAQGITGLLTDPDTAVIATAALAAAPTHPQIAAITRAFFADRMNREQQIFDRALARGELRPEAVPTAVMDLLAGAIWFRLHLRNEPVDPEYLNHLVDLVLSGITDT